MRSTHIGLARFGLAMLTLTATAISQSAGLDTGRMDRSVRACEDFFRYANGNWLKSTEIPAASSTWGSSDILAENTFAILRRILEGAAKDASAAKGSNTQLIGDHYATCMDLDAIEKTGTKALDPYFERIGAMKDVTDLGTVIGSLHRVGVRAAFYFYVDADQADSSISIANFNQGGLGLPSRDYYTDADANSKEIRDKYVRHVARMFELLGDAPEQAVLNAKAVMRVETRLALASKTPVELRDPVANYHKMALGEVVKLAPSFPWGAYAAALGARPLTELNVAQPDFVREVGRMAAEVPLADWKTYLRWNVVNAFAEKLPKRFDDQNFEFYGKTLNGTTEQLPRWRRCTVAVDNAVGEALGAEYVKKHFPPEAKKQVDALTTNMFAAFRERIRKLDWISDATRRQALAKLDAMRRKIGYPDKPRGYAGLRLARDSYLANSVAATEFLTLRDLRDIGAPVDKTRWWATAHTVTAYYDQFYNEIVFPAGILQPPYFNPAADDAVNYGALGSVIGHELTHGFDDKGSQYDAAGNLRVWWTVEDRRSFDARAECTVAQYDGYEVEKGLFINGKLTLGENLAYLGGLAIAYDAFQKSLEGKPRPADIDGFTPEQRFFLGNAQAEAGIERPEAARLLVRSDPHSLKRFRVPGVMANMPEFARAFSCKPGDRMVNKNPCKVW